ncbi:MAG: hypothetical protein HFJ55_00300 [Clostridia bacterium]|jgi:hypothetical protein|nr:hypothetical protein [Clostridia bacterium]
MKSERGATITSIIIYVIALTVVVVIVGRITTYFYKNVNQLNINTEANIEYTKFSSYITDEINIKENYVKIYQGEVEQTGNVQTGDRIVFLKTENQYVCTSNSVYLVRENKKVKVVRKVNNRYD